MSTCKSMNDIKKRLEDCILNNKYDIELYHMIIKDNKDLLSTFQYETNVYKIYYIFKYHKYRLYSIIQDYDTDIYHDYIKFLKIYNSYCKTYSHSCIPEDELYNIPDYNKLDPQILSNVFGCVYKYDMFFDYNQYEILNTLVKYYKDNIGIVNKNMFESLISMYSSSQNNITKEQEEGLFNSYKYRISIIVGGAGSGKTTLIKSIVRYSDNIIVLSFTGKAVDRIKEVLEDYNVEVITCHKYLYSHYLYKPDMIIIDEASMISNEMLCSIFKIISLQNCNIVLIGDNNQLDPIESSSPFDTFIKLNRNCVKLTKNFRSNNDELLNTLDRYYNKKYQEIKTSEVFNVVEGDYDKVLQLYNDKPSSQILTNTNKSCDIINKSILETKTNTIFYNKNTVFVNDMPVLFTYNNYELNLMNSTYGILSKKNERIFFNNIDITYELSNNPECIIPAYCITVDKSQGSQYNDVIYYNPVSSNAHRKRYYTAISRAKDSVIVVTNNVYEMLSYSITESVSRYNILYKALS